MTKKERQTAFIERQIKNLENMSKKGIMMVTIEDTGEMNFLFSTLNNFKDDIKLKDLETGNKLTASALLMYESMLTNAFYLSFELNPEKTISNTENTDTEIWKRWKERNPDYKNLEERQKNFYNSVYVNALLLLEPIKEKYHDTEPENAFSLKQFAALFLFSLFQNTTYLWENRALNLFYFIMPTDPGKLEEELKDRLLTLFEKLDTYFAEHPENDNTNRTQNYIDFIELHFSELFTASAPPEIKTYTNILQGKPLNALAHTSKKNMLYHEPSNRGMMLTQNDVKVFLNAFNKMTLKVTTHKVLDKLIMKITDGFPHEEKGVPISLEKLDACREVSLSVDEYANSCNMNDKKEARKQLNEAMQTLYNLSLEWDDIYYTIPEGKKRKTKTTVHNKARIIDFMGDSLTTNPIQNGIARAKFTMDVAKYLSRAQIMPYPNKMMTINSKKNPHSYYFARKLAEHHNMNIANKNSNRIGVKTLIEAAPDLPDYQTVMNKSRHIRKNIIDPFERDLDALCDYGILERWEYCNPKGIKLTEEQLASYSYSDWINWMIDFKLKEYPDQSKRIKAIETARETAEKRKNHRGKQNQPD